MAHELQLIKQSPGILIPANPETSEILQSKIKLGAVLVARFRQPRNSAFHRRFFALLNLGFEYWEPTTKTIFTSSVTTATLLCLPISSNTVSVLSRKLALSASRRSKTTTSHTDIPSKNSKPSGSATAPCVVS